jgi:hypothetical protein
MIILSVGIGLAALTGTILYYRAKKKKTPPLPDTKVLTAEEAQALFEKYFTLR